MASVQAPTEVLQWEPLNTFDFKCRGGNLRAARSTPAAERWSLLLEYWFFRGLRPLVFAETEIIGLLAEGTPPPDIAAGVQNAIAARVATIAGRTLAPPVLFHGRSGVAARDGSRPGDGTFLPRPRGAQPSVHRGARRGPARHLNAST